jgi:hypothetical protein
VKRRMLGMLVVGVVQAVLALWVLAALPAQARPTPIKADPCPCGQGEGGFKANHAARGHWFRRDLLIARAYWRQYDGSADWVPHVTGWETTDLHNYAGWAEPPDWMYLRWSFVHSRAYTAADHCVIVVHEFGHLSGHDHVHDTSDVMNPAVYPDTVPACWRLRRYRW